MSQVFSFPAPITREEFEGIAEMPVRALREKARVRRDWLRENSRRFSPHVAGSMHMRATTWECLMLLCGESLTDYTGAFQLLDELWQMGEKT